MASNYTSNYQLCQWAASDKVLRTEFNTDNTKIDAALAGLQTSVNGKASTSALNSLQSVVNGKASQAALDALSATVTSHTADLLKKGNCQLYTTSYVGTGTYNSASPNSISFPKKPLVVFVAASAARMLPFQVITKSWSEQYASGTADVTVTWTGNTVKWYTGHAIGQMNSPNVTYQVIALLQAD